MNIELTDGEVFDLLSTKLSKLEVDFKFNANMETWKDQIKRIGSLTRTIEVIINRHLNEFKK